MFWADFIFNRKDSFYKQSIKFDKKKAEAQMEPIIKKYVQSTRLWNSY